MTFRTRLKMCGMTTPDDVKLACDSGADAIGLVFYPPSPRAVDLTIAEQLCSASSLFVDKVLLFVNADAAHVHEAVKATNADIIQFHGDESPEYCQQFGKRYIKALRVKDLAETGKLIDLHQDADALLLDAYVKGVPGGTGKTFNWSLVPASIRHKLMLAGGLDPDNVFDAISQVRPYAVDVSGGLEASPGVKSAAKIKRFVEQVRRADQALSEISS